MPQETQTVRELNFLRKPVTAGRPRVGVGAGRPYFEDKQRAWDLAASAPLTGRNRVEVLLIKDTGETFGHGMPTVVSRVPEGKVLLQITGRKEDIKAVKTKADALAKRRNT